MKRLLILVALLASATLKADQTTYSNASVGGRWLNVMADPRETALAGANDALPENLGSIGLNPAGLSQLQAAQLTLAHNFWILDLSQEHAAYGMPLWRGAGLALGLDYLDLGSVEAVSLGSSGPVSQGYLHPYAMSGSLNWGQEIGMGLSLGAGAKYLLQHLDQNSANAFALDLGAQWLMPGTGISAGLAIDNLGTQLEGSSLPLSSKLGLGYGVPFPQNQTLLNLAAGINWNASDQDAPFFSLGEEFWVSRILALRAGYQFGNTQVPSGLSAGLGLRYGSLQLDYAYDARSSFSASQQMSLSYYFKNARSEGTRLAQDKPVEDEAAYEQLLDALNKKDYAAAQAMAHQLSNAQVQKVEKAYAKFISPDVFTGSLPEAEQVLKILVDLEPANPSFQERLGFIQWHLKKYDEARASYQKALLLDPSRAYLIKQMESTQQP